MLKVFFNMLAGSYIFIETSSPRRRGDKARLQSAIFRATGSSVQCLHFWYNMNGRSVGTLNVYLSQNGSMLTLWTLSGNQGTTWKSAQVSVQSTLQYSVRNFMHTSYKVHFIH